MTDAMFDEVSRCRQEITRLQRERDEVLEAHAAHIYRLRQEIERLTLTGIHSCHAECQRPVCRLTRERNAIRTAAQAVLDRWDSPAWEWVKQGPTAALMADLRAALAQEQAEPVQEPVAYRHLHEDGWEYSDAPTGEDCAGCQALFTAPPQRKPLTEEEIMQCFDDAVVDYADVSDAEMVDFARAVERAHGIGGSNG